MSDGRVVLPPLTSVAEPDRIRKFLVILDPDPDPLVRGMDPDPDPSTIKQKS